MSEEAADDPVIQKLTELPGVGEATAGKLVEHGFRTYESIAVANANELASITGLPVTYSQKVINSARAQLKFTIKTAYELEQELKTVKRITTGSKSLDRLLGGGVETRSATEFFGEFGSGKTQIAFQLSVNVQLPEDKGGLNGNSWFIDTEGTFVPSRVRAIAEASGLDPEKALRNVYWIRALNSDHQIAIIEGGKDFIKENNIKLIVIDSVTSLFRSEYPGRENLASRQQKLNLHLHNLIRLAEIYNVAVMVTNQVMSTPDMFYGDPTRAVGGNVLGHAPNNRVYLRKSKGSKRIARLVDSSYLEPGEVVFEITTSGIRDPAE
ncbi:MAG: DNA repair and recombination protein RadA [Thermoprotei archaeon]